MCGSLVGFLTIEFGISQLKTNRHFKERMPKQNQKRRRLELKIFKTFCENETYPNIPDQKPAGFTN